jgi:hypothetical protein
VLSHVDVRLVVETADFGVEDEAAAGTQTDGAQVGRRVRCANSVSCGEVVFVDESADAIAALDAGRWWAHDKELSRGWIGRREVQ